MASLFTKIIDGEIPCYKIYEDEMCLAFLDINPLKKGHTLLIPKIEIDKYFDLPTETLQHLAVMSKIVSEAIEKAFPCDRVGLAVIGLEVPHAHMHLIPIDNMSDMDFSNKKLDLTDDQFKSIAETIKSHL